MPILSRAHTRSQPVPAGWSKPTTIVDFVIFKSLPDNNPTVVKRKNQLTMSLSYLILCQRYWARVQTFQKFFIISAVSRTLNIVSPSIRTLTSIKSSRKNTGLIFNATRLIIFSVHPGTRFLFSPIGRAGYGLNQDGFLERLAMFGARKKPSFLKVRLNRPSPFQFLPMPISAYL